MGKEIVMSKYLVKLTPLGKFFFGGDMTFESKREKGNDDERYSSYIIHSFTMPQQTSLLGMLRFSLLSNDNTIFDNKENHIKEGEKEKSKVESLIGKWSFSVPEKHTKADFGQIVELGPCFLYEKEHGKAYFKMGMDEGLQIDFDKPRKACINSVEVEIPEILVKERIGKNNENPRYSGKDYLEAFYALADGSSAKKESELFTKDSRIGIDKDYEGKVKNAAFYKQISYRLKEGFCFALEVEIKDGTELMDYNGSLVKLGADASCFMLEIEKLNTNLVYPQNRDEQHRVVLVSDSYLSEEIKDKKIRYAITQIRPFRFLSTSNRTDAKDYNVKFRTFRSKKRYDLYQAGSVFYFKDKNDRNAFCKFLDGFEDFAQIGYNKYC